MAIKERIFITAGGTGGHVFPAIALAEELLQRGYEITFAVDARGQRYMPANPDFQVVELPITAPGRGVKKILFIWSLFKSIFNLIKIIYKTRVHKIVGFGGYPTLPSLIVAKILRKPIILHEQNAYLGRVNRFGLKWAKALALSYRDTLAVPKKYQGRVTFTGMPLRSASLTFSEKKSTREFSPSKKIKILILGGSQGAKIFNELMPKILKKLSPDKQRKLVINQQCPEGTIEEMQGVYEGVHAEINLQSFFNNVPELLDESHLVIARSGASTVAELALAGCPAILIPLPYAQDNHQFYNAQSIVKIGGGWLLLENSNTDKKLEILINSFLEQPNKLFVASENMRRLGQPQATIKLANLVNDSEGDREVMRSRK